MSFLKNFKFLEWKINKSILDAQKSLTKIKDNEWFFVSLSHDQLREKTLEFKDKIVKKTKKIAYIISLFRKQVIEMDYNNVNTKENIYKAIEKKKRKILNIEKGILLELLPEAFSVMKETAKRFLENNEIFVQCSSFDSILSKKKNYVTLYKNQAFWKNSWVSIGKSIVWNMIYYDAQLIGGVVLHQGKIAEMATGEGKTFVATLSMYLNSLTGRGVHIVTVNDYLARRDYAWMAPLMEFHGLSVDCIENHRPYTFSRHQAYVADITYGTKNEFVFDYLRDNIVYSIKKIVQRELHYAIIDEVDSVLIDECRTPIIISVPFSHGTNKEFEILKLQIKTIINQQRLYLSKTLNEARELILLGNKKKGGYKLLQVYRGFPNNINLIKYLSNKSIRSFLHKIEVQYMQDNDKEMPKIDENLYFIVNEKNNSIELTDKGIDVLSKNLLEKDFFILHDLTKEIKKIEYQKISKEEEKNKKEKILKNFNIKSVRINTINQLLKAYILFEKDVDYVLLEKQVKIIDKQTGRILEGHRFSNSLHQAIESKENVKIKEESQPIAMITLQKYFSLYHKLSGMTGTAETSLKKYWSNYRLDAVVIPTHKPIYRKDYQDIVFKTKREKYKAIIEEIIFISKYEKRPVLVGTTSVEVSELLSRMLKIRKISHNILNAKFHKQEANIISDSGKAGVVTIATNMAGRGTDIKLSSESKVAGGLAVLGVEHNDSIRVDRQLRGRSGRQGDPGSSKFFVSLEDSLMRLFGSYRLKSIMDKLANREDIHIQHSIVTNSIDRAQRIVEENNLLYVKYIHKYDEVINHHRKKIYIIRKYVIFITQISGYIQSSFFKAIQFLLKKSIELEKQFEIVFFFIVFNYKIKQEHNIIKISPVIYYFYNTFQQYTKIPIYYTYGIKNIPVFLEKNIYIKTNGKFLVQEFERSTTLSIIDYKWKEHIIEMDKLRLSIKNSIYDQKDPLLNYKGEAFNVFNKTLNFIRKNTISFLLNAKRFKINVKIFQEKWTNLIYF